MVQLDPRKIKFIDWEVFIIKYGEKEFVFNPDIESGETCRYFVYPAEGESVDYIGYFYA